MALKPAGGSPTAAGPLPTEIKDAGPVSIGNLVMLIPRVLGSAGFLIVLWIALAALVWVVLRVLTLMSIARRRAADV